MSNRANAPVPRGTGWPAETTASVRPPSSSRWPAIRSGGAHVVAWWSPHSAVSPGRAREPPAQRLSGRARMAPNRLGLQLRTPQERDTAQQTWAVGPLRYVNRHPRSPEPRESDPGSLGVQPSETTAERQDAVRPGPPTGDSSALVALDDLLAAHRGLVGVLAELPFGARRWRNRSQHWSSSTSTARSRLCSSPGVMRPCWSAERSWCSSSMSAPMWSWMFTSFAIWPLWHDAVETDGDVSSTEVRALRGRDGAGESGGNPAPP